MARHHNMTSVHRGANGRCSAARVISVASIALFGLALIGGSVSVASSGYNSVIAPSVFAAGRDLTPVGAGSKADQWVRPLSDTYVTVWKEQEPPPGYGGGHDQEPVLKVSRNDTEPRQYIALLDFELDDLDADAGTTYLELFVAASYPEEGRVLAVSVHMATSSWDAETVDTTSVPDYGPAIAEAVPHNHVGEWARWDVSEAMRLWSSGETDYGLVVAAVANPGARWGIYDFASSEGDQSPRLRIETGRGGVFVPIAGNVGGGPWQPYANAPGERHSRASDWSCPPRWSRR